ncbi:MAG: hypothetical protein KDI09_15030 [Halioglobus sp.]|nr:hypothetical protein [Halioglobus sp.]
MNIVNGCVTGVFMKCAFDEFLGSGELSQRQVRANGKAQKIRVVRSNFQGVRTNCDGGVCIAGSQCLGCGSKMVTLLYQIRNISLRKYRLSGGTVPACCVAHRSSAQRVE